MKVTRVDLLVGAILFVAAATPAMAAAPCVRFDVAELVPCQVVQVEDASAAHTRFVTAKFRVSSIIGFGEEESIAQLLFAIENKAQRMQVVDYSPKSQLTTDYASNLAVEETNEKTRSIGADIGVKPNEIVRADASASNGAKRLETRRFELLSPKHQLASSGTISRGSGVYFKIKPSSQTLLEGSREFDIVFQVPKQWRGDVVTLTCAGFQSDSTTKPICGSARFTIGLYLDSDVAARTAVEERIESERALRQLAASRISAIKKRSFPSLGHKLGAVFSLVDPKIPPQWLGQVLIRGAEAENLAFHRHLPQDVRQAVTRYASAVRATDAITLEQPNG